MSSLAYIFVHIHDTVTVSNSQTAMKTSHQFVDTSKWCDSTLAFTMSFRSIDQFDVYVINYNVLIIN